MKRRRNPPAVCTAGGRTSTPSGSSLPSARTPEVSTTRSQQEKNPSEIVESPPSGSPDLLESALSLLIQGLVPIPIRKGTKRPWIPWKVYQDNRPTPEQVRSWWKEHPDAQIAVLTGRVSGNFAVLDFDTEQAYDRFWGKNAFELEKQTSVVKTARGRHVWVRTLGIPSSFKVPGLVDVKGKGGYVLVPPSIHPSGIRYEFVDPTSQFRAMHIEEDLEDFFWSKATLLGYARHDYSAVDPSSYSPDVKAASAREKKCINSIMQGVREGCRNDAAFALALEWKSKGLNKGEALHRTLGWNKKNSPPDKDLNSFEKTVESAYSQAYPAQLICGKATEVGTGCGVDCVFYHPPPFSTEAATKARQLGKDPVQLLRRVQEVLETRLAGEYENRLFMLLAGVARNIHTTIVRVYGPNSVGKKMLYYWMKSLFGPENVIEISSATAAWLKRKVMQGYSTQGKIFILIEDRGDPNDQLRYQFEQIYSEDKIKLGLTVKADGDWQAIDVELEGPLTFITTSTELEASYHAQTRAWEVNPDESQEQSQLIAKWFRWRHLRSIKALESERADLEVIRAYLATLPKFKRIVIPYIDKISNFQYLTLADRRKLPDFTALLEAISYLFSNVCPKDETNGVLFSVPFVFDIAAAIGGDVISVSRGSLNRGERRVRDFLEQHYDEIKSVTAEGKRPDEGHTAEGFYVSDLCPTRTEFSDIHDNTMRNWLNGLAKKGYLKRIGMGRGKQALYLKVHKLGLVKSNGEQNSLIPKLESISIQDLEFTSSQIYEGMTSPSLNPFFSDFVVGNCELVNYRIETNMLAFTPEWLKTSSASSQREVCEKELSEIILHLRDILPSLQYKDESDIEAYLAGEHGPEMAKSLMRRVKPVLQTNPEGFLEIVARGGSR